MIGVPKRSHEKMYPIMQGLHDCPESELSFQVIGPELQVPCLLIHDLKDRYIPAADSEQVKLTIAGAKLMQTTGLGHMRILQDENVVQRIVAFIQQK
jgi:pimeloyl-ACP methyl ester carboxylesterase